MRPLIKIVDRANKGLEVLVGLALASMTAIIFFQVLVRFVFTKLNLQISAPWTEELSRYLMIWAVFIGSAIVARRADALAVEALVQAVPAAIGRTIKYCAHLLALVFYGCIFVLGLEWAEFGRSEMAPVLNVSMVYVYASMSIGAALTIVNAIMLLVETYIDKKDILDVIDFEMEEALADVEHALHDREEEVIDFKRKQVLAHARLAQAGNKEGLTQ
ncbi:MAG: TRAP transporter small permease [Candidimonas sp.]|nr:MAG: TRAP transporter small permease [Candidimonas sp.]